MIKKHAVLLFFLLCMTAAQAHAYIAGFGVRGIGGDTYLDKTTFSFDLFGETDEFEFIGDRNIIYGDLRFYEKSRYTGSVAWGKRLFAYGPSKYTLLVGLTSPQDRGALYFAKIRYHEQFWELLHLYGDAGINYPGYRFPGDNRVLPTISFGMSVLIDTKPDQFISTKVEFIDYKSILKENTVIAKNEVKQDYTTQIKSFSEISKSSGLILPKFITPGQAFTISKQFPDASKVSKISVKIENIKNKTHSMKQVSPNEWAVTIDLPKDFKSGQVNVNAYVLMKDGTRFQEFASTLVNEE